MEPIDLCRMSFKLNDLLNNWALGDNKETLSLRTLFSFRKCNSHEYFKHPVVYFFCVYHISWKQIFESANEHRIGTRPLIRVPLPSTFKQSCYGDNHSILDFLKRFCLHVSHHVSRICILERGFYLLEECYHVMIQYQYLSIYLFSLFMASSCGNFILLRLSENARIEVEVSATYSSVRTKSS